jgi:hypothetical protein
MSARGTRGHAHHVRCSPRKAIDRPAVWSIVGGGAGKVVTGIDGHLPVAGEHTAHARQAP